MSLLLFEDRGVTRLGPITTARPACCITVGSLTLLDLLRTLEGPIRLWVRSYLRGITRQDLPEMQVLDGQDTAGTPPLLALNARLVPSPEVLQAVQTLLERPEPGIVLDGDSVAAVVRPEASSWSILREPDGLEAWLTEVRKLPTIASPSLPLLVEPHDVIAANMKIIGGNLAYRLTTQAYEQQDDGVFLATGARLGEYVITDTTQGPILIDENASVGPYTLLKGPIYVGKSCRILEHAAIKDEVSLGHTTKIGGEVEASVIEPYTNKQHHGFLGHSYLGSWINLGAGTCNSDLKNTYGLVNMEYPTGKAATGMQFLGCVMGDYSKTAINTGIFTGKVIGVCSMMYGFVTSNVPSFVNYARLFGQLATLPPEVMIATQQRMFSRRKVAQRECDKQLLHDMYRVTQSERDRFGDEIAF